MKAIYSITNLINGKIYIGQTADLDIRWKNHLNNLKKNKHINNHLQSAWNKYGEENFKFEIVKECDDNDDLNKLEELYIKKYSSNDSKYGYNLTSGGEGFKLNEDVKNRISKNKRGQGSSLSEDDVRHIKMLLYCMMDRKEIANMFKVSEKVITQISIGKSFSYINSELNDSIHNLKKTMIGERNNYILSLYDNGMTISEIVKNFGYTTSIVEKCVYKFRNSVKVNKDKYREIYDKVICLSLNGMNNYKISKELNISPSTVKRYLDGQNNPYKELPFKKITDDIKNEILDLYFKENKTSTEIGEIYDVRHSTILSVINNYKYANTEVI